MAAGSGAGKSRHAVQNAGQREEEQKTGGTAVREGRGRRDGIAGTKAKAEPAMGSRQEQAGGAECTTAREIDGTRTATSRT